MCDYCHTFYAPTSLERCEWYPNDNYMPSSLAYICKAHFAEIIDGAEFVVEGGKYRLE